MAEDRQARVIDIRGKICPYTLLETRNTLKEMACGEVLEVLCDYAPAAQTTIPNFCAKKGYPLEIVEEQTDFWRLRIQKTD